MSRHDQPIFYLAMLEDEEDNKIKYRFINTRPFWLITAPARLPHLFNINMEESHVPFS